MYVDIYIEAYIKFKNIVTKKKKSNMYYILDVLVHVVIDFVGH
jgi:hypothetical protein